MKTKNEVLHYRHQQAYNATKPGQAYPVFPDPWVYGAMEEYAESYATQFAPKWVSVEERLPETDGELSDDVLISGRIFLYGEYSHIGTTIGWIDEKGTWGNIIPEKQKVFVTHWMPLPEPPKTV